MPQNQELDTNIQTLIASGVKNIDPRQVYIAPDVNLSRIYPGSILYPGTRIEGERTLIAPGAKVGTEGPVVLKNALLGEGAEVASGFLTDTILLPGAKAGANAHFRAGTLLEEGASTAHAVGLKQTILLSWATLGSLINFCDVLFYGGRSRKEHSEVGSGFVHFNFTPWGKSGDKATASLFGDVANGVLMDQPPIFLGGVSGIVGPCQVGFGAMTIAGQTIRRDVPPETMYGSTAPELNRPFSHQTSKPSDNHRARKREKNLTYIHELVALKAWYQAVRIKRSQLANDQPLTLIYQEAINLIEGCIEERIKRYNSFATEWGDGTINREDFIAPDLSELSLDWKPALSHCEWVWQLSDEEKSQIKHALSN